MADALNVPLNDDDDGMLADPDVLAIVNVVASALLGVFDTVIEVAAPVFKSPVYDADILVTPVLLVTEIVFAVPPAPSPGDIVIVAVPLLLSVIGNCALFDIEDVTLATAELLDDTVIVDTYALDGE